MKQQFRQYLSERYATNSVNSYLSGLSHLTKDYGKDIFAISDLQEVSEIRKLYDIGGKKRSVGDYSNGCARNAIIQYHNFISERGGEPPTTLPISLTPINPAPNRYTIYL